MALASQMANFSSLTGLGGIFQASRVAADKLKNSSHLILAAAQAFAMTMSYNFSIVNSGLVELKE